MNIDEYIERLTARRNLLESTFSNVVASTGNDLLQMIQERIQSRGVGADGSAFKDYTEEYKKQKSKKGRYKGVVDYTNDSRMWSDVQQRASQVSVSGSRYKLVIGPSTTMNEKKFESLTKRDGQIPTKASEEEIRMTKENLLANIRLELFG